MPIILAIKQKLNSLTGNIEQGTAALHDSDSDMMEQIFEHIMAEIERKKREQAQRKKLKHKLFQLLAEMVETERRYVQDLEQTCRDYLPLAGSGEGSFNIRSRRNNTRYQRTYSLMSSRCNSEFFLSSLGSESEGDISEAE